MGKYPIESVEKALIRYGIVSPDYMADVPARLLEVARDTDARPEYLELPPPPPQRILPVRDVWMDMPVADPVHDAVHDISADVKVHDERATIREIENIIKVVDKLTVPNSAIMQTTLARVEDLLNSGVLNKADAIRVTIKALREQTTKKDVKAERFILSTILTENALRLKGAPPPPVKRRQPPVKRGQPKRK